MSRNQEPRPWPKGQSDPHTILLDVKPIAGDLASCPIRWANAESKQVVGRPVIPDSHRLRAEIAVRSRDLGRVPFGEARLDVCTPLVVLEATLTEVGPKIGVRLDFEPWPLGPGSPGPRPKTVRMPPPSGTKFVQLQASGPLIKSRFLHTLEADREAVKSEVEAWLRARGVNPQDLLK